MRHNRAAAREFAAELGIDTDGVPWKVGWNPEAPGLDEPVVVGRQGHLYPYGQGKLGVYVYGKTNHNARRAIREHPDWKVLVEGDFEIVLLVHVSDLEAAGAAVKAYRCRKLTERERGLLAERLPSARAGVSSP
jgi:hypothetical protein